MNGEITQNENIADNGGIKITYEAYQTFVRNSGAEPILPEMSNYTPNQLFWISGAQLWCAVTQPEAEKSKYNGSIHAPKEFRVIGTFSNTKSFSRDFNCPPGSRMNRAEKCQIW